MLTYELITAKTPFDHKKGTEKQYENIAHGRFTFPENAKISAEAKDFIKKLLVPDPAMRLGMCE